MTVTPLTVGIAPEETLPTYLIGTGGVFFCRVVGSPTLDAEAYARLFGAAPELLAALQSLVDAIPPCTCIDAYKLRGLTDTDCKRCDLNYEIREAQAAIAKAKGAQR